MEGSKPECAARDQTGGSRTRARPHRVHRSPLTSGSCVHAMRVIRVRSACGSGTADLGAVPDRALHRQRSDRPRRPDRDRGTAGFKREFREVQEVEHPDLVSLGELVEDNGRCTTMELVDGTNILGNARPSAVGSTRCGYAASAISRRRRDTRSLRARGA
jgi:hypothetical protein